MANYEDTPTDQWIVNLVSNVIGRVAGKKVGEKVAGALIAAGVAKKVASKLKAIFGDFKSGVFNDFVQWGTTEKQAARDAGSKIPSWAELYKKWTADPSSKKWEDMTAGEKAKSAASKTLKALGLIGAIVTAAQTVSTAIEYGKDDRNRSDKSTLEWFWDTSIPGATVNMVAKWFGHGRKSDKKNDSDDALSGQRTEQNRLLSNNSNAEFNKNATPEEQGYDVAKYNKIAKDNNLGSAPSNPQAYNEWRKKVEQIMGKRDNPGNSTNPNTPDWYWKGKASKLLASTLTWSTIKNYYSTHNIVSVATFRVDLTVPVEQVASNQIKLHHEISTNIDILYEALRQKDTGAYQFTAADTYWYLVSMMSTIVKIRFLHKVMAIANTKSFEVQDLPKHMFAAMFGQTYWKKIYDDVVAHKADYAAMLNDIAKDVNTKAFLDCSWLSRWNYLADKCFADYNGPKSVKGTYIINTIPTNINDGNLEYEQFITIATTNSTFKDYIDKVVNSWNYFIAKLSTGTPATGLASRVSASMIKLLGAKDKTFGNVPYITGTETIKYEYDKEVFDQLRNARFSPFNTNFTAVPSYDGSAISAPRFTVTTGGTATAIDMGSYDDNDRIIATERNKEFIAKENIQMVQFSNMLEVTPISNGAVSIRLAECGTSMLNSMQLVHYSAGNAPTVLNVLGMISQDGNLSFAGDTTQREFDKNFLNLLSQVDYCPRISVVRSDLAGTKNIGPVATYFDIDNFAFMTEQQYKDLNRVAVYSQSFFFNPEDLQVKGIVEA